MEAAEILACKCGGIHVISLYSPNDRLAQCNLCSCSGECRVPVEHSELGGEG